MNVKAAKNKIFLYGNLIFKIAEKEKKLLLAAVEKIDSSRTVTINLVRVTESSHRYQLLLSFISLTGKPGYQFRNK